MSEKTDYFDIVHTLINTINNSELNDVQKLSELDTILMMVASAKLKIMNKLLTRKMTNDGEKKDEKSEKITESV